MYRFAEKTELLRDSFPQNIRKLAITGLLLSLHRHREDRRQPNIYQHRISCVELRMLIPSIICKVPGTAIYLFRCCDYVVWFIQWSTWMTGSEALGIPTPSDRMALKSYGLFGILLGMLKRNGRISTVEEMEESALRKRWKNQLSAENAINSILQEMKGTT